MLYQSLECLSSTSSFFSLSLFSLHWKVGKISFSLCTHNARESEGDRENRHFTSITERRGIVNSFQKGVRGEVSILQFPWQELFIRVWLDSDNHLHLGFVWALQIECAWLIFLLVLFPWNHYVLPLEGMPQWEGEDIWHLGPFQMLYPYECIVVRVF